MYDLGFKPFTLEASLNGLKHFGDGYFKDFSNRYEVHFTSNDSVLIFNKSNYIGLEILSISDLKNIELHIFISGVYLPDFYNELNLRFDGFYRGANTNLAEVFIDLMVYENINKDDFYDIFNILASYASNYEEIYV